MEEMAPVVEEATVAAANPMAATEEEAGPAAGRWPLGQISPAEEEDDEEAGSRGGRRLRPAA